MKEYTNFSLKEKNTFNIDAKCQKFFEYDNVDELASYLKRMGKKKYFNIGGGSNVLFLSDYDGIILHSNIQGFDTIKQDDEYFYLKVGAGVKWDDFVAYTVKHKMYGAENLSYIPGEVGASPVQNVGAYGVEAKDIIDTVIVYDIENQETIEIGSKSCGFAYRNSNFKTIWKNKYVVLFVIFRLAKKFNPVLDYGNLKSKFVNEVISADKLRNTIIEIRKEKLPNTNVLGCAGSYFMNPIVDEHEYLQIKQKYEQVPCYIMENNKYKIPAGWLIEQCGFKGKREENVGAYEKQALIIVNYGGADGVEVSKYANKIIDTVYRIFGIKLKPEVEYL